MDTPSPFSIRRITREAFAPFGEVLAHREKTEGYEVIVRDADAAGWLLAVMTIDWKRIRRIERHPTSLESFEPLWGVTLIAVAEPGTPDDLHVFLLDQPVCLHKGVWHQVMALSERSSFKIAENASVTAEYHDLPSPIEPAMVAR